MPQPSLNFRSLFWSNGRNYFRVLKHCCKNFALHERRIAPSSRLENEAAPDRMAARLNARPQLTALRRETVEHPFGPIKQRLNMGAFLMRGLEKVRGGVQPNGAGPQPMPGAQHRRHGCADGGHGELRC